MLIENINNPRVEEENHYYNPKNTNLIKLGLNPVKINKDILSNMMKKAQKHKDRILEKTIMPRIKWKKE